MSRVLVDSGVDWIGEIPEIWRMCRVKNKFNFHKNIAKEKSTNYDRIALTLNGVIKRDKDDLNGLQPENYYGYQVVYKDDLIFKLIDLENINTSRVGKSNYEGITSPAYIVLTDKCNTRYALYYFLNMWYQKIFNNIGGEGVRSALNKDDLLKIPYIQIEINEQKKIADYLDKKYSKIDEIIKDNNKEIELLEEYKKNIFTDVVNKYELKCYKLKYIIAKKLQYGANSSGIEYKDELPRYIRITDISNNDLKNTDKLSLTNKDASGFILNDGDILFARSGGTVGKSFMYQKKYGKCAFAGYLIRAQFDDKELSHYVYNYTNSTLYDEWKKTIFIQSTIQNIGADKYSIMPIPIPNDKRKIKIINIKIKNIINKVDKVIEYRKQIIEKLEEYKKSLIYECVTGKREV